MRITSKPIVIGPFCTIPYTIGNNVLYLFTLHNDKRAGHIRDSFQVSFKVFESSLEYLLYGVIFACASSSLFVLFVYLLT